MWYCKRLNDLARGWLVGKSPLPLCCQGGQVRPLVFGNISNARPWGFEAPKLSNDCNCKRPPVPAELLLSLLSNPAEKPCATFQTATQAIRIRFGHNSQILKGDLKCRIYPRENSPQGSHPMNSVAQPRE